jgi:hypothetical protein
MMSKPAVDSATSLTAGIGQRNPFAAMTQRTTAPTFSPLAMENLEAGPPSNSSVNADTIPDIAAFLSACSQPVAAIYNVAPSSGTSSMPSSSSCTTSTTAAAASILDAFSNVPTVTPSMYGTASAGTPSVTSTASTGTPGVPGTTAPIAPIAAGGDVIRNLQAWAALTPAQQQLALFQRLSAATQNASTTDQKK